VGVKAELFRRSDSGDGYGSGQTPHPGIASGRTLKVHGRIGKLENGAKAITTRTTDSEVSGPRA